MGFLKKGAAKQAAIKKDDVQKAEYEQKKKHHEEHGYPLFRFWLNKQESCYITFLDGDLDQDGLIDNPVLYQHQLQLNGSWNNFYVCTADKEPCPICEDGKTPSLVQLFTVIDHRSYESKGGKVYKNTRKLFVAKRGTMDLLQKIATKRGGLTGATFDASRLGEKAPAVGDSFDFERKTPLETIQAKLGEEMVPADYEHEFEYKTADELRAEGFGGVVIGKETSVPNTGTSSQSSNLPFEPDDNDGAAESGTQPSEDGSQFDNFL